jgi:hypothetical protein
MLFIKIVNCILICSWDYQKKNPKSYNKPSTMTFAGPQTTTKSLKGHVWNLTIW